MEKKINKSCPWHFLRASPMHGAEGGEIRRLPLDAVPLHSGGKPLCLVFASPVYLHTFSQPMIRGWCLKTPNNSSRSTTVLKTHFICRGRESTWSEDMRGGRLLRGSRGQEGGSSGRRGCVAPSRWRCGWEERKPQEGAKVLNHWVRTRLVYRPATRP